MTLTLRSVGFLLACGMLSLSSCSQDKDVSPRTEEVQRHYQQLRLELSAEVVQEAFRNPSTARSVDYDLGTDATRTLPKLKEIADDTSVIGIVRSSNSEQPVNYFRLKLTKTTDAAGKISYAIKQDDPKADAQGHPTAAGGDVTPIGQTAGVSFNYDETKSLGTLSMMLVVGGTWDETAKTLTIAPSAVRVVTENGRRVAKGLDVPYFSDWRVLDVKNESKTYLKAQLLKIEEDGDNAPSFKLKPQGILLNMRVENETAHDTRDWLARDLTLNSLTIRSSAYAASGKYSFDESQIKQGSTSYAPSWSFSDTGTKKVTKLSFDGGLALPYSKVRSQISETDRAGMYNYPNSPYVVTWMMPTAAATATETTTSGLTTEILADVVDQRVATMTTVYSNDPEVDQKEAAGALVVPRMEALPVYAAKGRIVTSSTDGANGVDNPLKSGTAYGLVLNVNRQPMSLELLSQYPLNDTGKAFTDATYSNVGYYPSTSMKSASEFATLTAGSSLKMQYSLTAYAVSWIPLTRYNGAIMFYGSGLLKESQQAMVGATESLYPTVLTSMGSYTMEDGNPYDGNFYYTYTNDAANGFTAYALVNYPREGTSNARKRSQTANHLVVLRYRVASDINGVKRMEITSRYIGPSALEAGYIPRRTNSNSNPSWEARGGQELATLVANPDYWNDALRSKDDVVRYFPLLGMIDTKVSATEVQDRGSVAYFGLQANESDVNRGYPVVMTPTSVRYYFNNLDVVNAGHYNRDDGEIKLPQRMFRSTLLLVAH